MAPFPPSIIAECLVEPNNRRVGKLVGGNFERGWLYDGQLKVVA